MKKVILTSLIVVSSLSNVWASCDDAYTGYLKGANQREAARNKYQGTKSNFAISGVVIGALVGTNIGANALAGVASVAVDTTGAIASTAVVPFYVAGIYLGGMTSLKIADLYLDGDKSASELDKIRELTASYELIKQARAGQGTSLESYMPYVWKQTNSSVSLTDLAEVINTLDTENSFCKSTDELDTSKGILLKAIALLK